MYYNHPVSKALRSIRHRPHLRNALFGGLVLSAVYVLYHLGLSKESLSGSFEFPPETHITTPNVPPQVWQDRAGKVKRAFLHAYHGYERYAAPHDELKPLSRQPINNFNGWGVSVFDSLDTMLLMGLEGEYERALPLVEKAEFALEDNKFAPYFETVIRYLGGLLSAYALTQNRMLLTRAEELAGKLDPIFATKTGFPLYGVNPSNQQVVGPEIGILAEMATLQMEYSYLAKLTGKKEYWDRVNTVIQALSAADLSTTGGMFPIKWNLTTAQPSNSHLSVGAQADSAHEYLLKQHLLTAKTDKASLDLYIKATTHIITNLLYLSPSRHLLYVTDTIGGVPSHTFEHLSCFLPGLLALGAHTLPLEDLPALDVDLLDLASKGHFRGAAARGYSTLSKYNLKDVHLWAAEGLAQTCWLTYADQPTGLGPEEVRMKTTKGAGYLWVDALEKWKTSGARGIPPGVGDKSQVVYTEAERLRGTGRGRDYGVLKSGYLLRPETVESLYIMWRVTGDPKWRDRGWRMFEAIEKYTKTPVGYASLKSVEKVPTPQADDMPSYFLAETLKYLYLLFIDEDPVPLDKWVFNTEAHPFPTFEWTEEEKELFHIS